MRIVVSAFINGKGWTEGPSEQRVQKRYLDVRKEGVSNNLNSVYEYEGFYWGTSLEKERVKLQFCVF